MPDVPQSHGDGQGVSRNTQRQISDEIRRSFWSSEEGRITRHKSRVQEFTRELRNPNANEQLLKQYLSEIVKPMEASSSHAGLHRQQENRITLEQFLENLEEVKGVS